MFLYFCSVLRKRHNILFAQSLIELGPRKCERARTKNMRHVLYGAGFPLFLVGCPKPDQRMVKPTLFLCL